MKRLLMVLGVLVFSSCDQSDDKPFISARVDGQEWFFELDEDDYALVANHLVASGIKGYTNVRPCKMVGFGINTFDGKGLYAVQSAGYIRFIKFTGSDTINTIIADSTAFIKVVSYANGICKGTFEGATKYKGRVVKIQDGRFLVKDTPGYVPG